MANESPDALLSVRFWGVRGSISCPGARYARYGGSTSCLEVLCGGRRLLFDAGTGIRRFGQSVSGEQLDVDLFLTHTHLDHISGLPFCAALYDARNTVRIWAGHLPEGYSLQQAFDDFMKAPFFPVPLSGFGAQVQCLDFCGGETLHPASDIALRTLPLQHPNGATGYRVEYAGRALCYITDTEHPAQGRDTAIVEFVRDADLLIYDSTFTDEEYSRHRQWGHSTWQEGLRIAEAAGVRTAVVFHHSPDHDDDAMDQIATEAAALRPGTVVAHEGLEIVL